MTTRISLDGADWEFSGYVGEAWRGAEMLQRSDKRPWKPASVPGTVYRDLWACGEIPDPYYGRNTLLSEWVPARYWVYRKKFRCSADDSSRIQLVFEGLDYEADVYLNGECLGHHVGMYVSAAFDVEHVLRFGGMEDNLLVVVLHPAPPEQPQVGRTSLVQTHKSRMTYWWDFCPRMIHVGIWDGVSLHVTDALRLEDVYVHTHCAEGWNRAEILVEAKVHAAHAGQSEMEVCLSLQGEQLQTVTIPYHLHEGETTLSFRLHVENPKLWWPNGLGEQNLYELRVAARRTEACATSDERQMRFGIRTVAMKPNPGAHIAARSYSFVVNGVPTYIKGWNWVPIDVMYGVEQPEKLRHLLHLAKEAGVNLLRVWGGGLIEKTAFYDLCDEFGLMVWQEFIQSSSGIENKPSTDKDFVEMMVEQAERIVPRRRNHPSLVLWCGGNELQDLDGVPLTDDEPVLAALRDVVLRLHPDALWLPTSPTGPMFMNSIANIERDPDGLHDVHGPWEHQGLNAHYELYNRGTSLFHSEFGVEGMGNLRTIRETIPEDSAWPATRENPIWNHRGSWWINEPLIQDAFGGIDQLNTLGHASQFLQADGLRYAVESNRRRAFHNSGTIPWQLNESYPNGYCTAAVDYYGRPKLAYYAVRRAYRDPCIVAKIPTQVWVNQTEFHADVFWLDSRPTTLEGVQVTAKVMGADGVCFWREEQWVSSVETPSMRLFTISCPLDAIEDGVFFLDLHAQHQSGAAYSQNRYVFSKTQDFAGLLALQRTELELVTLRREGDSAILQIRNKGDVAAIMVRLDDELPLRTTDFVEFDDSGFCLFPGEERTVTASCQSRSDGRSFTVTISAWNCEPLSVSI